MPGAIPPLPQYTFMAWCLVKAEGHLYLLPLPKWKTNQIGYVKGKWRRAGGMLFRMETSKSDRHVEGHDTYILNSKIFSDIKYSVNTQGCPN